MYRIGTMKHFVGATRERLFYPISQSAPRLMNISIVMKTFSFSICVSLALTSWDASVVLVNATVVAYIFRSTTVQIAAKCAQQNKVCCAHQYTIQQHLLRCKQQAMAHVTCYGWWVVRVESFGTSCFRDRQSVVSSCCCLGGKKLLSSVAARRLRVMLFLNGFAVYVGPGFVFAYVLCCPRVMLQHFLLPFWLCI